MPFHVLFYNIGILLIWDKIRIIYNIDVFGYCFKIEDEVFHGDGGLEREPGQFIVQTDLWTGQEVWNLTEKNAVALRNTRLSLYASSKYVS